ncbi:MAG TPA: hypothetical protein VIN65_02390 [Candidatus Dormibacteraeota bacterium]
MVQQAEERIDRPAPGHYQGRLRVVLTRHPLSPAPPRREPRSVARRQQRSQPRQRRNGQLAFPLEGL